MVEILKKLGVIAVLRAKSHEEAIGYIEACLDGGLTALELTYSIPDVCTLIKNVAIKYPTAVVGVGTVLNEKMAIDAIEAGAKYVVSPGFNNGINTVCKNKNIPYFPGCMTITEIMNAVEKGNRLVKIFPGEFFGPKYIKTIKSVLPFVDIMPTGGVNIDNVEEWFKMGVSCVGVGSSLTGAGSLNEIKELAKKFVIKIKEIRT